MCTVTYISTPDGFILTSNRDEKNTREQALPPKVILYNNVEITFPKDKNANGSWIGWKDDGSTAVLLNGALESHIPKPPYRKSRGLVFLDLLSSPCPIKEFENYDVVNIEPFTIVFVLSNQLSECRWDGQNKSLKTMDSKRNHIWSSATLYSPEIKLERENFFEKWLTANPFRDQSFMMRFHQFKGQGDENNHFILNRNNQVLTVSITSIAYRNNNIEYIYLDLLDNQLYRNKLSESSLLI